MTELWKPSAKRVENANITQFMAGLRQSGTVDCADYDALWEWSVTDKGAFWSSLWDFCKVIGEKGDIALENEADVKNARFFPNASLNYAENMLRRRGDGDALVFHTEKGAPTIWSWDDLHNHVSRLAQFLSDQGVVKGDRVAGFLPNSQHAIAAMLAAASLGAVWSSSSPDFGIAGVLDRFGQIEPKVLITTDGYYYNGKTISNTEVVSGLIDAIPSISSVVVVGLLKDNPDTAPLGDKAIAFNQIEQTYQAREISFERVAFDHPLFIMFSSGTTGLPKCIVHGHGGTLLQHQKEHVLQADMGPDETMLYFTTCGWMMWNWMVSALGTGARLVLYDGSPFYPDGNRLADILQAEKVTHFGTSAKYLDACAKAGVQPIKTHDLTALKTIFSTGSPLSPEGFDYVYSDWKTDVCLSSIAGGTDILGCFVGGSPISPVYRGQCQKRHLGMEVRVFDADGTEASQGQGELVCTGPHPSQPVGFWCDDDGSRYHKAYFDRFENVWCHGDFVELTEQGGMIFYGRSDAVLNPGGVRIGTAEIYRQVERVSEVLEGLVIGQQWQNDVRVVLFVRLRDGVTLDEALIKQIKTEIRTHATPRHVPAIILQVADIPRTKSGKITELAVRDVVHGREVKNTEAMANPEALDLYKDLVELQ